MLYDIVAELTVFFGICAAVGLASYWMRLPRDAYHGYLLACLSSLLAAITMYFMGRDVSIYLYCVVLFLVLAQNARKKSASRDAAHWPCDGT